MSREDQWTARSSEPFCDEDNQIGPALLEITIDGMILIAIEVKHTDTRPLLIIAIN